MTSLVSAAVYKRRSSITADSTRPCRQQRVTTAVSRPILIALTPFWKASSFSTLTRFYSGAYSSWTPRKPNISVGFYPARHYQPLVEIGSPKSASVLLTAQHVKTLSEHLPAQIDALWRGDFYNVMDGEFVMHSASPFNTAILTVDKKKNRRSVLIKLNDLRYLSYIFPMMENQLIKYTEAVYYTILYTTNTRFNLMCGSTYHR